MKDINWLGLFIAVVCSAISAGLVIDYSLGSSESLWRVTVAAAVGMAAIAWEVAGLHRAAHLRRVGRHFAGALCIFGLLLAVVTTVTYEIGSLAELLEKRASMGSSRASERGALEAERAALLEQAERAGKPRPAAVVEGDLAGIRSHARWTSTAGCSNVTAEESKELCGSYGRLTAELGAAAAIDKLRRRIVEINAELQPLAANGVADARANYLAKLLGWPEVDARIAVSLLLIAFLLFGRVAGGFVFMDSRAQVMPVAEKPQNAIAPEKAIEARTAANQSPAPDVAQKIASQPSVPASAVLWQDFEDEDEEAEGPTPEEIEALWEMEQAKEAAELLEAANAARAPRPQAELDLSQLSPAEQRRREIVLQFTRDCLIVHPSGSKIRESASNLWAAFERWAADLEIREVDSQQVFGVAFNAAMKERGVERVKNSGYWYVGVSISPAHAHRMAASSLPAEAELMSGQPSRLGGALRDRRLELAAANAA